MNTNTTPSGADAQIRAIACVLAEIDGYDPKDLNGGLYDLRWSGGPNPEPEGDAWHMDYLPKAEKIAAGLSAAQDAPAQAAQAVPQGWVMVPKEPTPEMLQIGRHAAPYRAVDVYRAMLVAAPAAPQPAEHQFSGHVVEVCYETSRLIVRYEGLPPDIGAEVYLAAQPQPAAQQGDALSYVHPVPDHCDRVVWRNRYVHLAAQAQEAAPIVDMTPPATARDRWMYEQGRLAERDPRTSPVQDAPSIEDLCARIKAADDAAADRDYMLTSDDCIAVLRGQWNGPLAMDKPDRVAQEAAPAAQGEPSDTERDAERYRWLRRKVSAHGVCDGWEIGFPSHLTMPAPAIAMRDPAVGMDAAIDAARSAQQKGGA